MKLSSYLPTLLSIFSLATTAVAAGVEDARKPEENKRRETESHGSHHTKIGLALNGGSFPAANGNAAVMRGFQKQKVIIDGEERPALEVFDFMSGLSGGNFPNVIYHYAQNTNSDELLETSFVSDPTKVTMADLTTAAPATSMLHIFSKDVTARVVIAFLYSNIIGGPAWPAFVYYMFLAPFSIRQETLMTDIKVRDGVKSRPIIETSMLGPVGDIFISWIDTKMNVDFVDYFNNMVENDEYDKITGLDELGINDTVASNLIHMNVSKSFAWAKENGFPIPIHAFGTDTEFHVPLASTSTMKFKTENATAEPLNFKPFTATYDELSSESDRFTLEKLLGMGSDVASLDLSIREFIPDYADNLISVDIPTADGGKREMAFSDGGYNDGTGIPALVQQKTKKIVSILNPSEGIFYTPAYFFNPLGFTIATGIAGFFGVTDGVELIKSFSSATQLTSTIFKLYSNGENQWIKLVKNMQSLQDAGEPMITTLEGLEVVDNPFFGIEGGWKVDLTVMFMIGVPTKFADLLPPDIAPPPIGKNKTEYGFFTNKDFNSVPNIVPGTPNITFTFPGTNQTIDTGWGSILAMNLPIKPARMTHIMHAWSVERAWDGLIGADGEEKFGGFRKLLEQEDTSGGGGPRGTSGSPNLIIISYGTYLGVALSSAALMLMF